MKQPAFILDRSEALTGTLIDDLIVAGASEPYRMFTSRSEYRLLLRAENADLRLSERAIELGLLENDQIEAFREKMESMESARTFLQTFRLPNKVWHAKGIERASPKKVDSITAYDICSFPKVTLSQVQDIWKDKEEDFTVDSRVMSPMQVECTYAHYAAQQVNKAGKMDYMTDISGLEYEGL